MSSQPVVEKILSHLSHSKSADTLELARQFNEDHQVIVGAVKSIQSAGAIITCEQKAVTVHELTEEGKNIVSNGSHEALVYEAIPAGTDGISQADLNKIVGANAKIGINKALQAGWIKVFKADGVPKYVRQKEAIVDEVRETLREVVKSGTPPPAKTLNELKKRKLITQGTVNYYEISRGPEFTTTIEKQETELTSDMVASGEWKDKTFKPYNFDCLGESVHSGYLHPLMKVRSEFQSILLEMGFSEMPTNRYVESAFWNFDALFVPQKHPARDAQDTFYVSQPAKSTDVPPQALVRTQLVHEGKSCDSLGYGSKWEESEAYKNVLRTHTTAISARMLYKIGQQEKFTPVKLFSIDKVFRNETLDATHLAEFHQVEGVVADRGINLGHLIGIMKEFFSKLGIKQLRFKPAYNPYTEPSMEVFAYHEGLKRWVEVGNSGMFRPEMLLPLGLPEDVKVIAWGLSLERPTMIRYGYNNIRDLVGPKVDLRTVETSPICRLDKTHFGDNQAIANPRSTANFDASLENLMNIITRRGEKLRSDKVVSRLKVVANHLSPKLNSEGQVKFRFLPI